MNHEFEKMDAEMMETFKRARNQEIPEGLLKNFSASVERKILERHVRPSRLGVGWAGLAVLGFAFLIFGAVLWRLLPATRPAPVQVPVQAVNSVILRPEAEESREILRSAQDDKRRAQDDKQRIQNDDSTEILSDIEALKELGVWTEEDEEKLGILAEERFSELELAFEDNSQFPGSAIAGR